MVSNGMLLGGSAVTAFILVHYTPQYTVNGSTLWTGSLLLVVSYVFSLIWTSTIYPRYFSTLRHLPTPGGANILLGHSGQIIRAPTGVPMLNWINEVPNDGLIRYMGINGERLLVTSPKALGEVLVTKNYDFIKPDIIRQGLARLLGVGVLLAEGDEHRRQRKDLSPAFAFRHVKDLYPIFWSKAVEVVNRIQHDIQNREADYAHKAEVVNVGLYTSRATLDIIGAAGMGRDFGSVGDPENKLYQTYKSVFEPPRFLRVLQIISVIVGPYVIEKLPIPRNMEINRARDYIRETCQSLIGGKRTVLEKEGKADKDILSVALESGNFTDDNLIDQMMTFLAAGHETTSTALLWTIYLLCKNTDVQRKLRDEIHSKLPSPRTSDSRTSVDAATIDSLPYLSAVCNETLRLWAPVSLTLRVAAKKTSVLGHAVPKGTLVVLCPWATNNSKALWGEDALEFKPERWLRDGQANKGGADSNYAFLTFLHGPRSCIGEKFARAEYACLLAAIVGRFKMEFETPGFEAEIVGGVTSRPKGGLWVKFEECEEW